MTAGYLLIVLKLGPNFMNNRKPYDLRLIIRLYNLILVAINAYLFFGLLVSFRFGLDCWGCGVSLSEEKSAITLHYVHLFFHTRYLEFFDTFFFILRKKYQQISFLHVFHHAIVPPLMYIGLKFYPYPFNTLLPITNTFVHIVMYAYYGLATYGPGVQPYLWWKKYLTTMQISQFVLLLVHSLQAILLKTLLGCKQYSAVAIGVNVFIGATFLSLFLSFYNRTYVANQIKTNVRK